jgi:ParB-like chromosome segregation protein Spo0J
MNYAEQLREMLAELDTFTIDQRVEIINSLKLELHAVSPFKSEPVDCVLWVRNTTVTANDYNPNTVAPPEMELLKHSIGEDGYTQPIVTWDQVTQREVIDGFHRHRVGKEDPTIQARVHGYLPVVTINAGRQELGDRMASTIRHNRARGKHRIEAMSDIVIELTRRNWSDERIAKNLGMEPDEVLRLKQISGLAEMFADEEFSKSWDIVGDDVPDELEPEL